MIPIMSNEYVPEFSDKQKTVNLSFRERWIDPLLHPVELPFEPWVKTKIVHARERAFFFMDHRIVCHPNNMDYAKGLMNEFGYAETKGEG